ncbi:hypothetical protein [Lentilitoribacter sp. Alg239-R112]|uniref:hypothetical protein n=1 Tax=Lentilitoribacter sp. Alg239-R112 TaxID=2305987 RepID=UPI0013A70378|nr:hypothetical protein [Lentilitoribacter sp. Alg239-R112]
MTDQPEDKKDSGNILIEYTKWLLKWLLIVIISLIALGIAIWVVVAAYEWQSKGQHLSSIHIRAEYDLETCREKYPIKITIDNQSKKTIEYLRFNIDATVPGRSTNVLLSGTYVKSDLIIDPQSTRKNCYYFQLQTKYEKMGMENLVLNAEVSSVKFK